MSFTIEYERKDKPKHLDDLTTYLVHEDGRLIARYWHDHRGDEHGIDFLNGDKEDWPVGRRADFLKGGGPEPLVLSDQAVAYLKNKTNKSA